MTQPVARCLWVRLSTRPEEPVTLDCDALRLYRLREVRLYLHAQQLTRLTVGSETFAATSEFTWRGPAGKVLDTQALDVAFLSRCVVAATRVLEPRLGSLVRTGLAPMFIRAGVRGVSAACRSIKARPSCRLSWSTVPSRCTTRGPCSNFPSPGSTRSRVCGACGLNAPPRAWMVRRVGRAWFWSVLRYSLH